MLQVRIHGRGGQGVVSGAELLSVAAFLEGAYAQAFPSFGSERMGAPVMAFCRIDAQPIRLREPVMEPDALIIQDATLLHQVDLFNGLKAGGTVLINARQDADALGLGELVRGPRKLRITTLAATEIAMKHVGRAVPNVPLLAAFASTSGVVRLESVIAAIRDKFPFKIAEANVAAATEAHAVARSVQEQAHA